MPVLTPQARRLPPLVPGRPEQGGAGRERARPRHHGDPALRLRDLGADAGRGRRPHQGVRRPRTRTSRSSSPSRTSSVRPSTSRGSAPSSRSSPSPAARSSTSPSSSGPRARRSSASSWRSGSRATATCRCCSTSGPTSCAGSCAPASSSAPRSSSGRRATPRTPPRPTRTRTRTRIPHEVYEDFMVNVLAMPVVVGMKTAKERFPGADNTLTCEGMMGDGKALQMGTSHELGQNFARVFEHPVPRRRSARNRPRGPRRGARRRAWWAGLIMAHGDDDGLRIPPRLAHVQVVVLAVRDEGDVDRALPRAHRRARRRGRARAARRRAPTSRSGAAPPTGSSRACRCASRWARATSPTVWPRWCAASPGDKAPVAARATHRRRRCAAELDRQQAALLDEATARRESRTPSTSPRSTRPREAADRPAGRASPWDAVGTDGEAELADERRHRCGASPGPTARCPTSDDEPDLVAHRRPRVLRSTRPLA